MGQKASVTSMLKARWSSRCLQQEGERLASGRIGRRGSRGNGRPPTTRHVGDEASQPLPASSNPALGGRRRRRRRSPKKGRTGRLLRAGALAIPDSLVHVGREEEELSGSEPAEQEEKAPLRKTLAV